MNALDSSDVFAFEQILSAAAAKYAVVPLLPDT